VFASADLTAACLPAGASLTFYTYHIFSTGGTDSRTMTLGPDNYSKTPLFAATQNPGIVVAQLVDQGNRVSRQALAGAEAGNLYPRDTEAVAKGAVEGRMRKLEGWPLDSGMVIWRCS
jgi:hypothetical protein